MGSKGTSTQQQTSSYSPSPQITAAGTQALAQGQQAAATPFNLPTAPVAGFNPQQQQAFQQYGQLQNIYQPYYNQAQGLFTQAAQGPNVSQFFNPYSQNVISQLQNQQQQQMNQLTGNATQTAGGVGADRIGVAQAELANQQNLATGQTLAGIYGSALTAAQGQQQQEQSAAYGLGQLGGANLQSGLAATGALYGSGAYQQQLNQAQLNAQYQNQLQAQAYPFQTAQYLGNLTSGLSGSLASTTNAYGQATPAQPSIYSQALGLGGLGLGVYGLSGGFGNSGGGYLGTSSVGGAPLAGYSGVTPQYDTGGGVGGGVGDDSGQDNPYGGNNSPYGGGGVNYDPNSSDNTGADIGSKYKDWLSTNTDVPSGQIQKGTIHQDPLMNMNSQNSSSGKGSSSGLGDISSLLNIAKTSAGLAALAKGGRIGYDDGGGTDFNQDFSDASTFGGLSRDDAIRYLANQNNPGAMPDALPASFDTAYNDRTAGLDPASVKDVTTFGGQTPVGQMPPRTNIPLPMGRPDIAPPPDTTPYQPGASGTGIDGDAPYRQPDQGPTRGLTVNPQNQVTSPKAAQPTTPDDPTATDVATAKGRENAAGMQGKNTPYPVPYPDANSGDSATSRNIMRNPWMALIAASAGTLGGGSPFALQNVGHGIGTGLQYMEAGRKNDQEEESINQRAQQLAQQAEFHKDEYTKLKPYEAGELANREATLGQQGWQKGDTNLMTGDTPFANVNDGRSGILHSNGQFEAISPGGGQQPHPAAPAPGGGPPPAGPGGAGSAAPLINSPQPPQGGPQVAAAGNGPIPQQTPATPQAPAPGQPPPFGMPELASNLEPGKSNVNYMTKGSPLAQASIKDLQTEIARQDKNAGLAASAAQDLGAMKNSYGVIMRDADKDGFFQKLLLQPGSTYADKVAIAKNANATAVAAGAPPPFDPQKLAAAENIDKIQKRLGMTFGAQISPREAFSGQKIGIEASPGLTNSPEGFKRLIAGQEAALANASDERAFFQNYIAKNRTSLGWRQDFEAKNPAERYLAKALVSELDQEHQGHLQEDVASLRKNPTEANKKKFDHHYMGLSNYFLNGHM